MCPQDSMLCCAAAAAHCKKGHEPVQLRWGIIPISDDPCHVIADALGAETSEGNAFFRKAVHKKQHRQYFAAMYHVGGGIFCSDFVNRKRQLKYLESILHQKHIN